MVEYSIGTHEIIVEIVWFDLYFANNNFNVCLSPKYSTICFHSWLNKPTYWYLPLPFIITNFMPPLKKGANCFATVGMSVCRPSVVRSISFDPFTWSIPNLVQGLPLMSRWSLLIFRSHVQRSRSNYSFEPSVLSTLYFLIHWLPASYRFCFYREDKPEFCTMGGIDVSETFLVFHALFFTETFHFMYTNKCSFYNFRILIWFDDGGYICSHCWYVFVMFPNVHVM